MVADTNPWDMPVIGDPAFEAFLQDPFFFYRALPVSPGLAAIFDCIFDANPYARIDLPELRKAIMRLETFFTKNVVGPNAEAIRKLALQQSILLPEEVMQTSLLDECLYLAEPDIEESEREIDTGAPIMPSIPAPEFQVALPALKVADELSMPELSDGSSSAATHSRSGDHLATPESDTPAPEVCVGAVDPEALGKALLSMCVRPKQQQKGTRKHKLPRLVMPPLQLFDKYGRALPA